MSETLSILTAETIKAFFSTVNAAEATGSASAPLDVYAYIVYLPASSLSSAVKSFNVGACGVLYLYVIGPVTTVVSDVPAFTA